MATPTRVYHYYSNGMSQPIGGLSTVSLQIALSCASLEGNCLVLWVAYDHGTSVTSVKDNQGQTWPAAAATIDGGVGNTVLSVFVLPNTTNDVRQITINFSAATHPQVSYQEYYNVVTASPVAQTQTATPTGSTIAAGSFGSSPTAGNLILQCGMANPGQVGLQSAHSATGYTAGTGFKLLAASRQNQTSNPWAIQERLADGSALNATFTATQAVADVFNTIAIELTAASVRTGNAPRAGIRILKTQVWVGPNATDTTWTENFPYEGDLVVMRTTENATVTLNTDSQLNTWIWDQQTAALPIFQHIQPTSPDSAFTVSFKSTFNPNGTWMFEDIIGSKKTGGCVGTVSTNTGTTATTDVEITHAPDFTPTATQSLVLVATPIGHGPLTDLHSPQHVNAFFVCVLYPEETDFDTMDNADGYANYLNGNDLSTISFSWRWNVDTGGTSWRTATIESWKACAVEYLSEPITLLSGKKLTRAHRADASYW